MPPDAALEAAAIERCGGRYSARSVGEVMALPRREQKFLLPTVPIGEYGASAAFVGEPGLGKSRFVLQMLAAQTAGLGKFAGIPLDLTPHKTLIIQSENSLTRLQKDLRWFYFPEMLSPTQLESLGKNLVVTTLESDLDADISIDDRDPEGGNFIRLKALIVEHRPEVLVIDPWAGVCLDELSAKAIRSTYIALRHACAAADCGPITIILLCHSKPGIQARASARGADALSYARGNRNLIGIVRSAINMRPCSDAILDGDPKNATMRIRHGIEIIWAKSNDEVLPEPTAVELNPALHVYVQMVHFDHTLWQKQLESMAKSNSTTTAVERAAEEAAGLDDVGLRVQQLLEASGPMIQTNLIAKMLEFGAATSKRQATERIRKLVDDERLVMFQPRSNRPAIYLTRAQAQEKFKAS